MRQHARGRRQRQARAHRVDTRGGQHPAVVGPARAGPVLVDQAALRAEHRAAAVLVVGLMFGKDNLKLFIEPRVERIPQEILADKNQLEFFQAMDMIEALSRLEAQDEPKSDATQNDRSRAELRGQTV